MYRPDRVILRKIQEYDKHLFVEWNSRRQYFEIWRHMVHGRRLITPIVRSLYDSGAPMDFAPLDERVLWWLYEADGWNKKESFAKRDLDSDRRFAEFQRKQDASRRDNIRHFGRDMWQSLNQRFVTTHASKNTGRPNFNKADAYSQWVRPDVKTSTGGRLYQRSAANAKLYGYRGK